MLEQSENIIEFDNNIKDLSNIYMQISIEPSMLFDIEEERQFLIDAIETIFDKEFLMIDTKELLNDTNKVNITFVKLIKFCMENKKPYKKIYKMFIEYCDYFDLPYNECYIILHEKLQTIIKHACIEMIGRKKFKKIDDKLNPFKVLTLFDLVK